MTLTRGFDFWVKHGASFDETKYRRAEEQVSKFTLCEESLGRAVKMQILNETLFFKKKTMIQHTCMGICAFS